MRIIKSSTAEQEDFELIKAIKSTQAEIDRVYEDFQNLTDSDLLEACIYELQSLKARYSFYLKSAKKLGISCGEEIFAGKKAE